MTQKGLTNFKRVITRFGNKHKIDLFYGNYYTNASIKFCLID